MKRSDDFVRISRFCAYQERSHHEVRNKLESFGNEERFAKAFAGGKFRIKNWGRLKIERALKAHNISSRCIAIGLREIDIDDYRAALEKLIAKKLTPFFKKNYKTENLRALAASKEYGKQV